MKILLLSPTELELSTLHVDDQSIKKMVCGVGGIALVRFLLPILEKEKFDLIILCGLAGGLNTAVSLGDVVAIENDVQGDLGVFENNEYHSFEEIGLITPKQKPNPTTNFCNNPMVQLNNHKSLSTSFLTDNLLLNDLRHSYYQTTIENMEGAAFADLCESFNIPYLQIRAISNHIGERDKNNWLIEESLQNLNLELNNIINRL